MVLGYGIVYQITIKNAYIYEGSQSTLHFKL